MNMLLLENGSVEESKKVLGLKTAKNLNIDTLINRFLRGTIQSTRVDAKNIILIDLIHKGSYANPPKLNLPNMCPHCDGRGFNIKFQFEEIKCPLCINGWKVSQCRTCLGTGRLNGVPCFTCYDWKTKESRGTYLYKKTKNYPGKKCLNCNGTGKSQQISSQNKISAIDFCEKCNKSGLINGNKKVSTKELDNLRTKFNNHR